MLPPMSWEPELEELRRREELARRMGGEERVERQHASGRLTVRERIERLFDAGTFHETGALAGWGTYEDGELAEFLPANVVVGQGRIDGRRAVVQGDDFTVRGGAADAAIWQKMVYAERMANELRAAARAAGRRHGRRRQRQVARDDGLHLRAVHPGLGGRRRATSRTCRWSPRRWGRWPGSARRAWSPRTSR